MHCQPIARLAALGMMCCGAFLLPVLALGRTSPASSPDANAYWLRCEETTTIQADGRSRSVYHDTVRLLNERALADADISIPYDSGSQAVTGIHARTIQPDGHVLPVTPADIHQTSPYSEYTEYNDAKNVAFSMPGAEPGAVLDYQYTVVTRRPLCPGRFSESTWLAEEDPAKLHRYTLIVPATLPISYRVHNAPHVRFRQTLSADGRRRALCWELRDTPDVTPESAMPSEEAYLPWLEISTWASWPQVAAWYRRLSAPRLALTPDVVALARRLTAGKRSEQERAAAIFYWVERHTRYVALELGLSAYQPHAAATILQDRYGDCKDMATLMIALLRAAGIRTAWPALLDTEARLPRHDHLATPELFDHVIVRADLDGRPFWFDATAEYCAFGAIPGGDRGLEGLVVRGDTGTFETIPQGADGANRMTYQKTVALRADGSADCQTVVHSEGDAAMSDREELLALPPDQLADHFAGLISGPATVRQVRLSSSACADPGAPLTYGVRYLAPAWAVRTGRLLIVSDGFSFTSPATLRRRAFPLTLDTGQQVSFTATIRLPPGYVVEALPENSRLTTDAGTFGVRYTSTVGVVTVHKEIALRPVTIPVADYPKFRAACDRFLESLKQPIVLCPADLTASAKDH